MDRICIAIFLSSLLSFGTCDRLDSAEVKSLDTKHAEDGDRVFYGRISSVVKSEWESECWESPFYQVTYIGHPWDCKAFLMCYKGKAMRHECPEGSAFNPDTSLCVPEELLPYNTTCRQSPEEICKNYPDGYNLEDREDCHSYYICADGQALHLFCPSPLVFDSYRSRCAWSNELWPGQPCSTSQWTTTTWATNTTTHSTTTTPESTTTRWTTYYPTDTTTTTTPTTTSTTTSSTTTGTWAPKKL